MDIPMVPIRKKQYLTSLHTVQWSPCLQLRETIITTPSGLAALTTCDKGFTSATQRIPPTPCTPPWRTSTVTIDHTLINPDIDMKPAGLFAIHQPPPYYHMSQSSTSPTTWQYTLPRPHHSPLPLIPTRTYPTRNRGRTLPPSNPRWQCLRNRYSTPISKPT
jgi:hypothetical protein